MTPRSKFSAAKYHLFLSKCEPNNFEVKKIDIKEQKAYIPTKGLRKDVFLTIRKLPWVLNILFYLHFILNLIRSLYLRGIDMICSSWDNLASAHANIQ